MMSCSLVKRYVFKKHIYETKQQNSLSNRIFTFITLTAAGFEVLVALLLKIKVVWNVTACQLVHGYRNFRQAQCLHF